MRFAVEILDLIFSFLSSDHRTLLACMKDPILSPIVKRHLYLIIVYVGPKKQANKYHALHQSPSIILCRMIIAHYIVFEFFKCRPIPDGCHLIESSVL